LSQRENLHSLRDEGKGNRQEWLIVVGFVVSTWNGCVYVCDGVYRIVFVWVCSDICSICLYVWVCSDRISIILFFLCSDRFSFLFMYVCVCVYIYKYVSFIFFFMCLYVFHSTVPQ
jgi:hypothetical protein